MASLHSPSSLKISNTNYPSEFLYKYIRRTYIHTYVCIYIHRHRSTYMDCVTNQRLVEPQTTVNKPTTPIQLIDQPLWSWGEPIFPHLLHTLHMRETTLVGQIKKTSAVHWCVVSCMSHPLTVFRFHKQVPLCTLLALYLVLCTYHPKYYETIALQDFRRPIVCSVQSIHSSSWFPRSVQLLHGGFRELGTHRREEEGGKCPDGTVHPSWWRRFSSCALLHSGPSMHQM